MSVNKLFNCVIILSVFSKSVNGVNGPSIVVHVCDEAKNGKLGVVIICIELGSINVVWMIYQYWLLSTF